MRRIILLAMTLLLCMAMVLPVCAQKQEFVPSITYKDGVTSVKAEMNGEKVDACIVITPIKYAMEKTTDITQPARELLLETYEKLEKGTMKLPLEKDYVIVELVDISFAKSGCEDSSEHDHQKWLQEDGNAITIEMGNLSKGMDLIVFTYNDGQWTQVEKVVDNGDGTYTCVFEHFCPVVFCVEAGAVEEIPTTGETGNVFLWLVMMLAAAAVLAGVMSNSRRRAA